MIDSRKQAWWALVLVVLAVGVFYWRIWTPRDEDRAYFEGDIFDKDYPARAAWVRTVRQGVFPFWNAYEFGGWPALANCEAGVLYPLNWLLVPAARGGQLSFYHVEALILLHFVLAGWFLFLLGRQYGLAFWPAALAALVYMFSGFHGGHKLHVNLFCTVIWFPLILYFVERSLEQRRVFYLLAAALGLGVAYLAGHPQMAYSLSALLALRLAWELPSEAKSLEGGWREALKRLGGRGAVLVLPALALAAAQILPAMELFELSRRAGAGRFDFAVEFSLPPQELVEFLLPATFGWYFVEVFYVGLWAWLLAWVALGRRGGSRVETYWLAVLSGGLLLALGKYAGLLPSLYRLLPGLGKMRAPSRWLYFVDLAVALLAGWGLQSLMATVGSEGGLVERLRRIVRWILAVLVVVLIYLYIETLKPYPQVHLSNLQSLTGALVLVGLFLALGWLLLTLYRRERISVTAFGICFVLLIYVDLATYNNKINVVTEKKAYEDSPVVEKLRREQTERIRYLQPDDRRQAANGNVFGLEEAGGASPLAPKRYWRCLREVRRNPNLLRLLGVRYGVGGIPEALKDVAEPVRQDLWRIPGAFPRAFAVDDVVVVKDPGLREALLGSEAWDFARVAWVDREPGVIAFQPAPIGSLEEEYPRPIVIYSASRNALRQGAYILVGGRQVCPDRRGYNLVVINEKSGEVLRSRAFDVLSDPGENENMAQFIRSVPNGRIVAGAVADEATLKLNPAAAKALRKVGVGLDLSGHYRKAHAFLGIKGFPPGTALEVSSEKEAILVLGSRGERFIAMTSEAEKQSPRALALEVWKPGSLRVKPDGSLRGFVIVTEKDYPGWRASQGGTPLDCVQGNTLFLAVGYVENTDTVELVFRPTRWGLGLFLSISALVFLLGGLWRTRCRPSVPVQSRSRKPAQDFLTL